MVIFERKNYVLSRNWGYKARFCADTTCQRAARNKHPNSNLRNIPAVQAKTI